VLRRDEPKGAELMPGIGSVAQLERGVRSRTAVGRVAFRTLDLRHRSAALIPRPEDRGSSSSCSRSCVRTRRDIRNGLRLHPLALAVEDSLSESSR